jgi:hypothetical protein
VNKSFSWHTLEELSKPCFIELLNELGYCFKYRLIGEKFNETRSLFPPEKTIKTIYFISFFRQHLDWFASEVKVLRDD